ncbi:MAG: prolipoprotein diacylglyceryl transferase [Clostridia bacterium]|nr:prolipoprotein diacylglyceryl transferase [Clostridia bacterium]
MHPYISIFGAEFSSYSLMAIVGLLVAGFIFCRRVAEKGGSGNESMFLLLAIAFGMYAGGHVLFFITNAGRWHLLAEAKNSEEFFKTFSLLANGLVFYGGLIGASLCGLAYLKIRKLPKEVYMDSAALFAPLFHGFARVGCFLSGCCYGIESSFGFADAQGVTRFPVQLLEAACNFAIAAIIFVILKKGLLQGKVFYLYLAVYAFVRFFDEFLRGDEIRGFVLGLSTSQFISIFVEVFALVMLFLPIIKNKTSEN